jgi:hypothetical protein
MAQAFIAEPLPQPYPPILSFLYLSHLPTASITTSIGSWPAASGDGFEESCSVDASSHTPEAGAAGRLDALLCQRWPAPEVEEDLPPWEGTP